MIDRWCWIGMARILVGLCAMLGLIGLGTQVRAGETDRWQAMLRACVAFVENGERAIGAGWTRGLTGGEAAQFDHFALDVAIDVGVMPDLRVAYETICANAPTVRLQGNDAVGLALRTAAHEVLDGRLAFREEDQTGPPDVWRGCARDGQEYRLMSMTQTTHAYFWIAISPRDATCTYLGA